MKYDKRTLEKINSLNLLDVADRLGISYSRSGRWRKALCFCHNDHTPSMGLNESEDRWKCFSCGHGGNHITLVMEHENLTYPDALDWLVKEFNIQASQRQDRQSLIESIKRKLMNTNNTQYLDNALRERFHGTSNELTRALVQTGILTPEQMQHAAETFRLSTADDHVIFWQIDQDQNIREGKVMAYQADAHRSHDQKPVTVSWLLKSQHQLPTDWKASFCLFGLHQIALSSPEVEDARIAIVESEKTAIICCELLADDGFIWMATGGKSLLSVNMLLPLKGRKIIIFPDTDTDGSTFAEWRKVAQDAAKQFGHPITVSPLLERVATADQKARKIDIADYLIEGQRPIN